MEKILRYLWLATGGWIGQNQACFGTPSCGVRDNVGYKGPDRYIHQGGDSARLPPGLHWKVNTLDRKPPTYGAQGT
jgi:hypothetical protein